MKTTVRKARPGEMFYGGGQGIVMRRVTPTAKAKPEPKPKDDKRKKD